MAEKLVRLAQRGYVRPVTFRGVGGMKVFRDEVWGNLRFVFQADHRHYRKHGFYDFPQYQHKTRLFNHLMILLTKIPAVKRRFQKKITEEMLKPLKSVLEHK
jgi:hypothetical protein